MPGLDPLLSGLRPAEIKGLLGEVWWLRWVWQGERLVERASLEAGWREQPEQRLGADAGLAAQLGEADQQVRDQCGDDLQGDGIAAGAEEALQAQVLLDPLEEQLDLPAAFVERGDARRRGLEVVGEQGDHAAAADLDLDHPHRLRVGVASAGGLALRQGADDVGADLRRALRDAPAAQLGDRGIGLEAGGGTAGGGPPPGPPAPKGIAPVGPAGRPAPPR